MRQTKYEELEKKTLIKLGNDFDRSNDSMLLKFLNNNKDKYAKRQKQPDIVRKDGSVVSKEYYAPFWIQTKKDISKSETVENLIKNNMGNKLFQIPVPIDFSYKFDTYNINGIWNVIEMAYYLSNEIDDEIRVYDRQDQPVFSLFANEQECRVIDISISNEFSEFDDFVGYIEELRNLADTVLYTYNDKNLCKELSDICNNLIKTR